MEPVPRRAMDSAALARRNPGSPLGRRAVGLGLGGAPSTAARTPRRADSGAPASADAPVSHRGLTASRGDGVGWVEGGLPSAARRFDVGEAGSSGLGEESACGALSGSDPRRSRARIETRAGPRKAQTPAIAFYPETTLTRVADGPRCNTSRERTRASPNPPGLRPAGRVRSNPPPHGRIATAAVQKKTIPFGSPISKES